MSGLIQVQSVGPLTGPEGTVYINLPITISGTVLGIINSLANGNNTITPPTGVTTCLLIPPAGNVTAVTLQGTGTDLGIALHPTAPTVLSVSGPTAFRLLAGGAIAAYQIVFL